MSRFGDALEKAKQNNIDVFALLVANECSCFMDATNKDFERFCAIVGDMYLNTYHMALETLCNALKYAIEKEDFDINERLTKSKLNYLVELACSFD